MESDMSGTRENAVDLVGRILISAMFLISGFAKISGYAGTQAYMESAGVPGMLLPLVIALEVLGALAIIAGFRTRLFAALLALFSILAAFIFHGASDDQLQSILFMKNIAIAGGFLFLVARGAGEWSVDARRDAVRSPDSTVRG
jgi:putative oxidoreductase